MTARATKIEWTDRTWNPTRGCRRVSPGCENCYAERQAIRQSNAGKSTKKKIKGQLVTLRKKPGTYHGLVRSSKHGPRWTGKGAFDPVTLAKPLSWKKPQRIFVDSMSDLFFEAFTFKEIAAVFGVMAAAHWHTFQILTKRPERALEFFRWLGCAVGTNATTGERVSMQTDPITSIEMAAGAHVPKLNRARKLGDMPSWPLENVWIGVSVESQEHADKRVPLVLQIPAAVHFLSMEPLLDATLLRTEWMDGSAPGGAKIDWAILGGESGPKARRCNVDWIEDLVHQLAEHKTPCFVKQLGSQSYHYVIRNHGRDVLGNLEDDGQWERVPLRHRKGGDVEEWPLPLRVRQMPERTAA